MENKHPAKYTDKFIPIFARYLKGCNRVYDPMAGTGKIALVKDHGFQGKIYCTEIEKEWTSFYDKIDHWHIGDASQTDFIQSSFFDAICTSPTYGNRVADHHNAKDGSKRLTYTHTLGRKLHENNTGKMQWGEKYRRTHERIYIECKRVLNTDGIFILNMSDHIRKGEHIRVTDWHKDTLTSMGFTCVEDLTVKTSRMGFGANSKLRVNGERILVLKINK